VIAIDLVRDKVRAGAPLSDGERQALLQLLEKVAPPTRAEHQRLRDSTIRDLAEQHFAHLPTRHARATAIASMASRYTTTGWPRDRGCVTCPKHLEGRPEALLWRCFKLAPEFPTSARHIYRIIE
jgi:hypothetical protein